MFGAEQVRQFLGHVPMSSFIECSKRVMFAGRDRLTPNDEDV